MFKFINHQLSILHRLFSNHNKIIISPVLAIELRLCAVQLVVGFLLSIMPDSQKQDLLTMERHSLCRLFVCFLCSSLLPNTLETVWWWWSMLLFSCLACLLNSHQIPFFSTVKTNFYFSVPQMVKLKVVYGCVIKLAISKIKATYSQHMK